MQRSLTHEMDNPKPDNYPVKLQIKHPIHSRICMLFEQVNLPDSRTVEQKPVDSKGLAQVLEKMEILRTIFVFFRKYCKRLQQPNL